MFLIRNCLQFSAKTDQKPGIYNAHTMYKKVGQRDTAPENFELPFNGQLSLENPWVVMASLIPWEKCEDPTFRTSSILQGYF